MSETVILFACVGMFYLGWGLGFIYGRRKGLADGKYNDLKALHLHDATATFEPLFPRLTDDESDAEYQARLRRYLRSFG